MMLFYDRSRTHQDLHVLTPTSPTAGLSTSDYNLPAAATAPARLARIQLHKAAPQRTAEIRARTRREFWTAIPVKTRADLDAGRRYADAADRLLYDAKTPDDAPAPGGMGLRFDWALLDGVRHPLPWAL